MDQALHKLGSELVPIQARLGHFRIRGINNPRGKRTRLFHLLKREGLHGKHSYEKQVPQNIFISPKKQVRLFLSCLWRCDGTINVNHRGSVDISYSTSSKILAQQVQTLLTYFGINTSIYPHKTPRRLNYQVVIIGSKTNRLNFLDGILEQKDYPVRQILEKTGEHSNIDTTPHMLVKNTLEHTPWYLRYKCNIRIDNKYDTSRKKLERLIKIEPNNQKLKQLLHNDIRWDTIKSIKPLGKKPTFGLEIKDYHNHVVDGIISHNTKMLGVTYPLWIAAFQKNKIILIVGNTLDSHAKPILKQIKNEMLSNKYLNDLVPTESNASWTQTGIDTSTGCEIVVRPNTVNVRGIHADYALCDEVSLYEDKEAYFTGITATVNSKKGSIACIGTPMTDRDLLADLQRNPAYYSKTYTAIIDENTPKEHALWENRFSLEHLARIKMEQGSLRFEREYMCKKIPIETQLITRDTIDRNRINLTLGDRGNPEHYFYIGGDLAISQQKSADKTVFIPVEQIENYIVIKDIIEQKGAHIKNQKDTLRRLQTKYNPQRILLDKSTFGEAMVQELRMEGLPVQGYSFDANSRMELLNNLVALFDADKIKIPTALGRTKYYVDILIDELTSLGTGLTKTGQLTYLSYGRHPDMSMALALACYPLKYLRQTGKVTAISELTQEQTEQAPDTGMFVVENPNPPQRDYRYTRILDRKAY